MTASTRPPREFADLPLSRLDAPMLDGRIDRNPAQLDELLNDISKNGLIYPLIVARTGERYEIVDGYTRFICCRRLSWPSVWCEIYDNKDAAHEGVKYRANIFRLEMTPADEAKMFHELLHNECGGDIDRLCAMTSKKRGYIDDRLELLSGDAAVFDALREGKIGVGVALKLNEIESDHYRAYYLEHAIRSGATVSMVTGWIQDYRAAFNGPPPPPPPAESAPVIVPGPIHDPHRCYICGKNDPRFLPELVSIHTHCKLAILDPILGGNGGGQ